jgi:hypothetical protein
MTAPRAHDCALARNSVSMLVFRTRAFYYYCTRLLNVRDDRRRHF